MKKFLLTVISAFLLSGFSLAQSNDIAVLAGGIFTSDKNPGSVGTCTTANPFCGATVTTPSRISYEGALAHRLINLRLASLHLELPVVGTPNRTLKQVTFRQDFSTVFFTPGLRLRVSLPFFSPFVSVGGGFAHYSPDNADSSTVAAFQVGGGFDISTPIPLIGFRAEVRNFHTGTPNFSVGQNQIFAGGGLVLKF